MGEETIIPEGMKVGKNTAIIGATAKEDYPDGCLKSGECIIKAGDIL